MSNDSKTNLVNLDSPGPKQVLDRYLMLLKDMYALFGVQSLSELANVVRPPVASVGPESAFHTIFGRDAIYAALDLVPYHPEIAAVTIKTLAALQGIRYDSDSEEEPGRIMHEHREPGDPVGEQLKRRLHWVFPYYGTVDATPLFIRLVVSYVRQVSPAILSEKIAGRDGRERTVAESLAAALDWVRRRIASSDLGFLEYHRSNPRGLRNQVLKDSESSFFHADGTLANHDAPIAAIEVQGHAFDALYETSEMLEDLRESRVELPKSLPEPWVLRKEGLALRERVLKYFWLPEELYFAMGLDRDPRTGDPRAIEAIASNPGYLLDSTFLASDLNPIRMMREAVIARLCQEDFLTESGIRTVSSGAKNFRPGSYHSGSVWPVETNIVARGLRRHGYHVLAQELEYRMLQAILTVGKHVEFFRGEEGVAVNREIIGAKGSSPLEQLPQDTQAWTVTGVYRIRRQYVDFRRAEFMPSFRNTFERDLVNELRDRKLLRSPYSKRFISP